MTRDRREIVCRVIVLGSTGSIGTQSLEVIEHLNTLHARGAWPTRFEVVGLAAGNNADLLRAQATKFKVARTCHRSRSSDTAPPADDAEHLIRAVECDLVIAAISGIAGLPATLAAVELGRDVALANKETLVAAGSLVIPAAQRSGSRLLPIDSEHSGVWQCLEAATAPPLTVGPEVARITLTASGGPFRSWSKDQIERATIEDALKHPTWTMGRKVTIDSATLVNKALEIVEAHWLFGLPADKLAILIHPQSIVHAMVQFSDGSTISQMGAPDMRTPIQYALTWPGCAPGCARALDAHPTLTFEQPDLERFPGLALAYRALEEGGTSAAVLNAANEVAVSAFLSGSIKFTRIAELIRRAMDSVKVRDVCALSDVLDADQEARRIVNELI